MAKYQFVMRTGPTPGKVYPLEDSEITIGRENTNNLPINDAEVSRKHAKLELRGNSYVIQDLGSTNGTFVNGTRITAIQVLNPGDTVSFGENITLNYEPVIDPNATMLSSAKAPPTAAVIQKPAPSRPVPSPVSAPVATGPEPSPAFSGQVPAGPAPVTPTKKSASGKLILIILGVIVLCIALSCIITLIWIDADKTGGRWCQYLPFIVRIIGGVCQ